MIDARSIRRFSAFGLILLSILSVRPIHAQASATSGNDPYRKWLAEDVRWIIHDQERSDLTKLSTDEQRKEFVIAFWNRRNPNPGAAINMFKEEHYRRLAYANQHFAEGIPGWQTDRGHFYISYGPPDAIEKQSNSQGGVIQKPCSGGEEWHWNYVEALGHPLTLRFVEVCDGGEFHLRVAKNELTTK